MPKRFVRFQLRSRNPAKDDKSEADRTDEKEKGNEPDPPRHPHRSTESDLNDLVDSSTSRFLRHCSDNRCCRIFLRRR
jgi:hypothetical protein